MIYSKTKDEFDENYNKAMELLHTAYHRHVRHVSSYGEFVDQKDSYASYILYKKGTRGKYG